MKFEASNQFPSKLCLNFSISGMILMKPNCKTIMNYFFFQAIKTWQAEKVPAHGKPQTNQDEIDALNSHPHKQKQNWEQNYAKKLLMCNKIFFTNLLLKLLKKTTLEILVVTRIYICCQTTTFPKFFSSLEII